MDQNRVNMSARIDALIDAFNRLYGEYERITHVHTYYGVEKKEKPKGVTYGEIGKIYIVPGNDLPVKIVRPMGQVHSWNDGVDED